MKNPTLEYAQEVFTTLKTHYPKAKMILEWTNNFELLVSIILSAQCTDKKVNEATKVIFPKYRKSRKEFEKLYEQYTSFILSEAKDPRKVKEDSTTEREHSEFASQYTNFSRTLLPKNEIIELVNFAEVLRAELEQDIKSTGFYHNKAKNIQAAAKMVLEKFHGILPKTIAELTTIPGVGRKTANVFLGNAYGISEGIAVDTHVNKQAQLLGLTKNKTPEKIEQDLMHLFPKNQWFPLTYLLIEHGRNMRRKMSDQKLCHNPNCLLCTKN